MSDQLPSIAWLQAFATVAETLSFKEAAARLHVSASALSRQVAGLEEHLRTPITAVVNWAEMPEMARPANADSTLMTTIRDSVTVRVALMVPTVR